MSSWADARPRNDAMDLGKDDNPAPVPFFDAVRRGDEAQYQLRNDAAREARWRDELWARHREIERRAGRKLPLAHGLTGERDVVRDPLERALDALIPVDRINAAVGGVRSLTDEAYEKTIQALRQEHPKLLAGVETYEELRTRIDRDFNVLAKRDNESFNTLEGGAGGVVGGTIGYLKYPPNLIVALATGGVGAGRPLLARMGQQFLANAGVEALQTPGKMDDAANFGGPAYGAKEAAFDMFTAGIGAAGLEAGGAGVKALARQFKRLDASDPTGQLILRKMELEDADAQAVGPFTPGPQFDAADHALKTQGSPPPVEFDRDLSELFQGDLETAVNPTQLAADSYRGRRIYQGRFDPMQTEIDPQRFQYKADGDSEGVTARLRGVQRWDPTASGKVVIWEDEAGARFIADGHQRRGLAKRLVGEGFEGVNLDGYLFRAADGWSAREVRVVAALKNIREGSGSILDAAKILRDAPSADDGSLPVTGDFMSAARGLSRLSQEAFEATVNKVIPERYAAEIGNLAGARPDLHGNILKLIREAEPANQDEARALVQEALLDDFIASEGAQADLFGRIDMQSTTIARAKVKAAVLRALKSDAKVFGQLVRHADAIEAGGNALARDQNQAALALDHAALELVSKLSLRAGPIGEAMAEAARAVAIKNARAGDVAKGVVSRIRSAIAAGERLDEIRGEQFDPSPPSAQSMADLAPFSEPGGPGQKAQAEPKPEDAEFEEDAALLFDDEELASMGVKERKVQQALVACAPGRTT